MDTEKEMLFEFALYQSESILIRGGVRISTNEETNAFGEHFHEEAWVDFGKERALVSRCVFKGLILNYKFEQPACPMMLHYYDCQLDAHQQWQQTERLKAALRIGVHDSEDWENITLGPEFDLAFRCKTK